MYILQDLVRQAIRFLNNTQSNNEEVDEEEEVEKKTLKISLADFEHRARQVNIHDVTPFFTSRYFVANGFRLESGEKLITKDL